MGAHKTEIDCDEQKKLIIVSAITHPAGVPLVGVGRDSCVVNVVLCSIGLEQGTESAERAACSRWMPGRAVD